VPLRALAGAPARPATAADDVSGELTGTLVPGIGAAVTSLATAWGGRALLGSRYSGRQYCAPRRLVKCRDTCSPIGFKTGCDGGVLYSATSLVHGSGFLAVFIAGLVLGDARLPYKGEIVRSPRRAGARSRPGAPLPGAAPPLGAGDVSSSSGKLGTYG
jgi:hypothetical protein